MLGVAGTILTVAGILFLLLILHVANTSINTQILTTCNADAELTYVEVTIPNGTRHEWVCVSDAP